MESTDKTVNLTRDKNAMGQYFGHNGQYKQFKMLGTHKAHNNQQLTRCQHNPLGDQAREECGQFERSWEEPKMSVLNCLLK
jgi:hypothetical protein